MKPTSAENSRLLYSDFYVISIIAEIIIYYKSFYFGYDE